MKDSLPWSWLINVTYCKDIKCWQTHTQGNAKWALVYVGVSVMPTV